MATPDGDRRARPPSWVTWLVVVLAVVLVLVVLMLVLVPPAVTPHHLVLSERRRLSAEANVRTTILQCLGGLVVLAGLGFTARSVYVSRETHLTDRLAKAIDQLGHERAEVRMGGIYALQRLAHNSPLDHQVIANVLTGYLRIYASEAPPMETPRLAPDVQTALSVLVGLP